VKSIRYVICFNCGKITLEKEFCSYCHSPLFSNNSPAEFKNGVLLGFTEKDKAFRIPLEYFRYHFAFYGVTGTGKTRAAMNLAVRAENQGLSLRIIDVEGEWKNIIPNLKKETVYYEIENDLKINPFDLNDIGLTRQLLKETVFMGIEQEFQDYSPQMNFLLDKCILKSRSIPELIYNVIHFSARNLPFKLWNINATKTALLTRLNPFKDNPVLRNIFYVKSSNVNLNSIENKNVIIDLHNLDRKVAYKRELRLTYNFLVINYLRKALAKKETNNVNNLFVVDEAQLLIPKIFRKATATETWMTTDFATRLRKRGESLVIITQSPANIEDDVRKNAQNIFIFRLQDSQDIKTIAGMLGYVHINEISHLAGLLANLESRKAIVKTPAVKHPFVLKTPDINFETEKHDS